MVADVTLRPFEAMDLDWLVEAHGTLYAREAGFDDSFAPLVEGILQEFLVNNDPALERGWVAEHDAHRLGSIFCAIYIAQLAGMVLRLNANHRRKKEMIK